MNTRFLIRAGLLPGILTVLFSLASPLEAQSWKLTPENIDSAIHVSSQRIRNDSMHPAFHLTPPAGCMGDPNGGIYHRGWYHIFYGLNPFASHPAGWYWAHARSRDLLHWEHMEPRLTPFFDEGLNAVGSGSTIITPQGERLAFYSQSRGGGMEFWRAEFSNDSLSRWSHPGKNPVLTLDHPDLPPFDDFWRDPYVFRAEGRTFMIACADLFEEDYVPVPIFEAENEALTEWTYRGNLFTVPKHRYRNLEVPEFKRLGDKWIFMASTDAPVDRTNYFTGEFDPETLSFTVEQSGPLDYSGHFYAQETIMDSAGNLFLMGWIPGWDRPWLPMYRNAPLKNSNPGWNGCFALPRKLTLEEGTLIQQPAEVLKKLRGEHVVVRPRELPVDGPTTAYQVIEAIRGDQLEIRVTLDLHHASFCGINVLTDSAGRAGLFMAWSGNVLNVDGVRVPIREWEPGEPLSLHIFVDKKMVEVFVNGGRYCITRQAAESHVRGDRIALTSLGGTAKLHSLEAWKMEPAR